jgi:hypothetical protein
MLAVLAVLAQPIKDLLAEQTVLARVLLEVVVRVVLV